MSNAVKVAIVVGALFAVGIVGLSALGMGMYEDEVCEHLKQQESLRPLTGPITECETRLLDDSGDAADTFVFRVRGSAGRAAVYVTSTSTGPDGAEEYQGILAVGDDGTEVLVEGVRPNVTPKPPKKPPVPKLTLPPG